jgi:hypothetical protein
VWAGVDDTWGELDDVFPPFTLTLACMVHDSWLLEVLEIIMSHDFGPSDYFVVY